MDEATVSLIDSIRSPESGSRPKNHQNGPKLILAQLRSRFTPRLGLGRLMIGSSVACPLRPYGSPIWPLVLLGRGPGAAWSRLGCGLISSLVRSTQSNGPRTEI
ncbi:hypothetical protein E3N88_25656 [Mikania micrantha]|uniref:Uncharacterized protein n=1 Tax=Mikania micrantha TaxID=192012 RepID=A0A5N6N856_9ASTR|nr:hypothetical protein E3N88_25656 [Mikania micrantha]